MEEMQKGNRLQFVQDLMEKMQNSKDLISREFMVCGKRANIVFLQDLTSYPIISEYLIKPLLKLQEMPSNENELITYLTKDVIQGREVQTVNEIDECIFLILKGKVLLVLENVQTKIILDATKFNMRAITEPPTSSVLQGPREGFIESIKTNLSMVRRRLSTPNLSIENMEIGRHTKTSVSVMYLTNIADDKIVKLIVKKLKSIDIDGIVDSYYLVNFLQEHKNSIFRQIGTTEKPDIVTSKLLEGRVAIFVDGSPIVLTLPFLVYENFQSSEDYYSNHYHSTFVRWLRLLGIGLAILLPGVYVSLQLYHYGIIPLKFLVTIANSTDGLPFTPLFEVLFIMLLFELLNEASLRMPKYLGMAMSIVGALILGDTAVKAGVISPPAVMIIALSSMTIFTVADLSNQLSLLRLGFVLLGGMIGIYGVLLGIVFLIGYLSTLDSYGAPYLAPMTPKVNQDMKDFVNMKNILDMKKRPKSFPNKNPTRLKAVKNEKTSNN
ncbi:MAG: spore germination protein [Clostridia bacterium]|nr:spore germination protein [Clostridia bacterium]